MKLRPLLDHLIVKAIPHVESNSIILPETASKERNEQGEVLAIGDVVTGVNVGDRILFRKYAPDEIEFDGEKLLVLTKGDIIAVIE